MPFRFAWLPLSVALVLAQQPPVAPADVHVTLSIRDGKTAFRMGEPIRLVLSFTADRSGYAINTTTTNPASPIDDVVVSPTTGVFPWLDIYSSTSRYSPDYLSTERLASKPTEVVLALNHWVRFDEPGEYTARVTTKRLVTDGPGFPTPVAPLLTNTVSFRIERMSDTEEDAEIRRIAALLDATPKRDLKAQTEYCEDLAFLTGDAAAREKVGRYFLPADHMAGNWQQDLSMGFFISRNPQLIVGMLDDRLDDLSAPATSTVISLAEQMRLWEEMPSIVAEAGSDKALLRRLKGDRTAAIGQEYSRRIIDSLPLRTGESRRLTAHALVSLGASTPPQEAIRILRDEFDKFDRDDQRWLVESHWKALRDPSLAPALKRLASTGPASERVPFLKPLLDVAPDDARPLFVAAMLDSMYFSDFRTLNALPQATLPEVDAPLLAQLQRLAATGTVRDASSLELKSALVARYATGAIQSGVLEMLDKYGERLAVAPKASLLAYLSKWNAAAARPLVEQALVTSQDANMLLYRLTEATYPSWIDQLMRERLDSDDPQTVGEAASRMSEHGPAEDLIVLRARLDRWLSEWSGRQAELQPANNGSSAEANLQVSLIRAILLGRSWKLSDAQASALKQTCLTDICRRAFAAR